MAAEVYSNSVNSVAYFALLPFRLNDAAVNKRYIGTSEIKGEPYFEIEVTFQQKGGGKDHDDVFIYWIHQQHFTMDYLAYSFIVDGGGTRFRKRSMSGQSTAFVLLIIIITKARNPALSCQISMIFFKQVN